jgi:predicted NAD/FAD-dependent oxidoreductase
MTTPHNIAIVGAGIAGITCARTLVQAGHRVTVFEKSRGVSGRMSTRNSPFGTFDHGAQYFTVRDPRFAQALETAPGVCRPWSANAVQVLDSHGMVAAAGLPGRDQHWVAKPGMNALVRAWAQPLLSAGTVELETRVTALEPDALQPHQWQLRTAGTDEGSHVYSGFDRVVLAIPGPQAEVLLHTEHRCAPLARTVAESSVAPCWTLMLAFPQAMQPGLNTLGPQWNAARSTHHRIAWLARESSKPGRGLIERWTIQASAAWSQEHLQDDEARVTAKLIKAFSEITGIRAEPAHAQAHRWLYAKTERPLGVSHVWDASLGVGICGDWCIGHRVEDAFVSGLEMALQIA